MPEALREKLMPAGRYEGQTACNPDCQRAPDAASTAAAGKTAASLALSRRLAHFGARPAARLGIVRRDEEA